MMERAALTRVLALSLSLSLASTLTLTPTLTHGCWSAPP